MLSGHAYPPQASRQIEARLLLAEVAGDTKPEAILVNGAGEELARASVQALTLEPRLGRTPRQLRFPDGTLFETEDHDGVDRLQGDKTGDTLYRLERFHPRLALFALATVGAVWLVWRYGLDVLVAAAVALTPAPLVTALDAAALNSLDGMAEASQRGSSEHARAAAILHQLTAVLDEADDVAPTLTFRDLDGAGPNAFALPAGTIVLTDALLRVADDDMLAGVIAHELGHVVEDHGLKQLYRSLGAYALLMLFVGDAGVILESLALEGHLVLSLAYSRAHEREADAFAVALTADAGFDPRGLINFLKRLDTGDDGLDWLSTHPSVEDRVETLQRLVEP